MHIGFIPVLVAFVAALTSLHNQKIARGLWFLSALLVTIWSSIHGSNHIPELLELGSWG